MAESLIPFDKELPEIPGRRPWERPISFLIKDPESDTGWRIDESGRRPSNILMVEKLRQAVDEWRNENYPGASNVTKELFRYWFQEDHEVKNIPGPFRYYFCQREAMETLAYLIEIAGKTDIQDLIGEYAKIISTDLFTKNIEFETTMDGRRRIRRYVPELKAEGVQDLPPEDLRRYAFKMATGSGKTLVMAMAMAWSFFHKKNVPGSPLSTNFLIVAPNVIVYQRLKKDFEANKIFHDLPLIPPQWMHKWNMNVILRGNSTEPTTSGNLFLTNIQQLYESREKKWTPQNAVEAILGPKPVKDIVSVQKTMLERVKSLSDLVVMNDEAHHVHDEDLAWNKSLMSIHENLTGGLNLWLDFSATPKDQNGMFFPWIICDYPLAQAVEDRIVKAPIIVTKEDDPKQPAEDPKKVTKKDATEKYGYWIQAAVARWKEHNRVLTKLGITPILFVTAEVSAHADAIGKYLWETPEFGFKESEVLIIHTDSSGEITKKDLEKARELARNVDKPSCKIKAIVSVMMLREGWDVRNVSIVLGLRPFTAKSEILPEQVIGRGLRLMRGIGPDQTQTLEVLGTKNLLKILKEQLEAEGVGVTTRKKEPPRPIIIEPVIERLPYDISIPITKPRLVHNTKKIKEIDPLELQPIFEQEELDEVYRIKLRMEFATTETEVHHADILESRLALSQELISAITSKVMKRAKLPSAFKTLYPIIKKYVKCRCFGREIDLDNQTIRSHLNRIEIQEAISNYLARIIAGLIVEKKIFKFENAAFKLSDTSPFSWRRNLPPPLVCKKTVFNYVATYNDFERRFAQFLDCAPDVLRFASLGTTEQDKSGTQFRVDYLKPSGAIGFYYPDWVVVQEGKADKEINWIIETKGRVWEGTRAKDHAIKDWCRRISEEADSLWKYARINQKDFDANRPSTLGEAVKTWFES